MIGDSEKVMNYECSANKVQRYLPSKDIKQIYHTNHPLASDDLLPEITSDESTSTSYKRYELLDSELSDLSIIIDIEAAKKILSTHPVCVHRTDNYIADFIIIFAINDLKKNPVLHLTLGPPCSNEFQGLHFS